MAIREGTAEPEAFYNVIPILPYFNPPQISAIRELWLLWVTDIISSRYTMDHKCALASSVMTLVWRQIGSDVIQSMYNVSNAWLPPLLGFLQLGEETHWAQPRIGVYALQILSRVKDFSPTILPILTSTLQPTHPLHCRGIALRTFHRFGFGLLSSQMESISSEDRASLLRAVGIPFQFTPDTEEQLHTFEDKYNPLSVAAILIWLASSDLWQNHLRRSNFVSCEEITSTEEGRQSVYELMHLTTELWPFLRTPIKIISVIECLEVFQCPNTAGAVLTSVWGFAALDGPSVNLDGWRLVRQKTLALYKTRRIGQLNVLPLQITLTTLSKLHRTARPCRVEGIRSLVRIAEPRQWWDYMGGYYRVQLAQVCQRITFYQLFGCSPTEWDETFADHSERVDKGVDVSVGQSGVPAQFVDCACDYP